MTTMMQSENSTTSSSPPIYDNSFYRRRIIRPAAKIVGKLLWKLGFSANAVCWVKLVIGLAGAGMLSGKSSFVPLMGCVLLQLSFLLDAADGEVARLRGEAGFLSGEFWDKISDHLPKTAMYFFWGYGGFRLSGSHIPLFCGVFLAAWNIYPRFCAVETLLERLDKVPAVYGKANFTQALKGAFVISEERGRIDYYLTVIIHPSINLVTLCFILENIIRDISLLNMVIPLRMLFLYLFTFIGLVNFFRKTVRFFRLLDFS